MRLQNGSPRSGVSPAAAGAPRHAVIPAALHAALHATLLAVPLALLQVALLATELGAAPPTAGELQPRAALAAPEDRSSSPYTGYTRRHWLEINEKLIAGVLQYFDPRTGRLLLEPSPQVRAFFDQLPEPDDPEMSFARSMNLVAIYTAATGSDRIPGWNGSIVRPYLAGIIHGTDPTDPWYWGDPSGRSAKGTDLALAILLSPRFFWEPLTPIQRQNVLTFLKKTAETPGWDNNHWYFHMIAVPVLERGGMASSRPFLTEMFRRCLGWYRGDGWFIDGGNFTFDYYNLWGFQLYNHALCHFDPQWERLFGERVRQTGARFEESFPLLYGRDGGPIPWGRSLTYRWASLSGLGWSVLNGSSTLPPGQARRIASGCLKYFWEHGAMSENGLLEVGFRGPNPVVPEDYHPYGSPYWAAQGLSPLLIPADHPFWTERELPMPADSAGGRLALPGAQLVLKVSPVDGEARCYVVGAPVQHQGMWQRGVKYFQHGYSSYLGWCAAGEGGEEPGAGRAGSSYDGRRWHYRTNPRPLQVNPWHCISQHELDRPVLNPVLEEHGQMTTHTLIGEEGELHVFWHNSARPVFLGMGGYGISVERGQAPRVTRDTSTISLEAGPYRTVLREVYGPEGVFRDRLLEPREGWHHSHLFGGRGAYPWWQSSRRVEPNTPVAIYVHGVRGRRLPEPELIVHSAPGALQIDFEGRRYAIPVPY